MTDIEPGSQSDQPFAIRPRVVGTASVLMIVFGAIAIVLTLVLIAAVNNDASQTGTSVDAGVYFLFIVQIVLSASQILSGVYIRPGRSWAWIVGITVCGLNLLFGLSRSRKPPARPASSASCCRPCCWRCCYAGTSATGAGTSTPQSAVFCRAEIGVWRNRPFATMSPARPIRL